MAWSWTPAFAGVTDLMTASVFVVKQKKEIL